MLEKVIEFYENAPIEELTKHLKDLGVKFVPNDKNTIKYSISTTLKINLDLQNLDKLISTDSKTSYSNENAYKNKFVYSIKDAKVKTMNYSNEDLYKWAG